MDRRAIDQCFTDQEKRTELAKTARLCVKRARLGAIGREDGKMGKMVSVHFFLDGAGRRGLVCWHAAEKWCQFIFFLTGPVAGG
jgi:hypothetical protein